MIRHCRDLNSSFRVLCVFFAPASALIIRESWLILIASVLSFAFTEGFAPLDSKNCLTPSLPLSFPA